ncbi:MAG: hypothetical protein GXY03_02515 [Solirubrobacterales bacterium]|nr:hypothetical protein [Solirubrobacterales bacterium]
MALLAAAGPAVAGSYTVVSCNAAPNHSGQAWQAQAGSVNSYQLCPSLGGGDPNTRGISTRAVGRTFSAGEYSRWWFFAPPGTTISRLDWAGRGSRNTPSWVVEISAQGGVSHSRLIGYAAQPGATSYAVSFEVPSPTVLWAPAGTTSLTQNVQCGAGSCGSGATMHTYHAAVTLHDHWAPGVSMSGVGEGEWVRGDRTIAFAASDNTGIKRVELLIDGALAETVGSYGCDYTRPVPCSNQSGAFTLRTADRADGPRRIDVRVVDGSDTVASTGRTIRVDNTPPAQVTPTVVGGEGWRRGDGFDVRWASVADGGSPIAGGRWQLCRTGTDACQTGSFDASNPTGLNDVGVGGDGSYELRVALRDQVGNQADLRDARPVRLRLDRAAPTVALDPHDPARPMQASARVADALSGVAGGQIEIQRRGGGAWHEIPTSVEGGRLVGVIDDERYTDGTYDLRARTVDHAGNEASTQQEVGGARAARQLPLRIKTRLTAGHRKVVRTRRTVLRGKGDKRRRRQVVRKRVQFRPRVTVGYRRAATLQGRLTNPDGQPLADVAVEVSARPQLPGSDFAAAGLVRTDGEGRFSYRVAGTHCRTLRFRYPGTSRIRPVSTDVTVAVRASSSFKLTPRRILNGETVTFTGRVRGGPIPPTGKLVELRKWSGRRWEPFRVVRSQPDGRWRHTEPVRSVRGLVTFRLRARLPAEAGYPYAAANTPVRKLRVRGANP